MSEIYFTSDLHFGHKSMVLNSFRPFKTVEEMDETIIQNWNSKISKNDDVYFLGDLSFYNVSKTEEIINRLTGRIHWVTGNHDKKIYKKSEIQKRFEWIKSDHILKVPDSDILGGNQVIHLYHFPLLIWDRKHYGSWNLHGHSHGNLKLNLTAKRVDMSTENWNFFPQSYSEVKKFIKEMGFGFEALDHHSENHLEKDSENG